MSGRATKPKGRIDAQWAARLEALGLAVRARIMAARRKGTDLASVRGREGGDTIFAVDRHVEPVIQEHIKSWPDAVKPLVLVAEGMGRDGRRLFPPRSRRDRQRPRFLVLIDPIDGTRNLMYDKRAAWFIAAAAPFRGAREPTLGDAVAAALVELPTSKAGYADAFTAVRGGGVQGRRVALLPGVKPAVAALRPQPSCAKTLLHGYGQVSNFFPGTKVLASELMERIVARTLGGIAIGVAGVFDDQYTSTAGQMVELMMGRDRFCCDLRPLFYQVIAQQTGRAVRGLECHPYDCAGLLVAQAAGVIFTDGLGRKLDAPASVHHGVHWCGYANAALRKAIEPVIVEFFAQRGISR